MELFIPIVHSRTVLELLSVYEKYFDKMAASYMASDTAKQEFFMRLQLRLQSLHKHDFISNQLNIVLLLINTTTLLTSVLICRSQC